MTCVCTWDKILSGCGCCALVLHAVWCGMILFYSASTNAKNNVEKCVFLQHGMFLQF